MNKESIPTKSVSLVRDGSHGKNDWAGKRNIRTKFRKFVRSAVRNMNQHLVKRVLPAKSTTLFKKVPYKEAINKLCGERVNMQLKKMRPTNPFRTDIVFTSGIVQMNEFKDAAEKYG